MNFTYQQLRAAIKAYAAEIEAGHVQQPTKRLTDGFIEYGTMADFEGPDEPSLPRHELFRVLYAQPGGKGLADMWATAVEEVLIRERWVGEQDPFMDETFGYELEFIGACPDRFGFSGDTDVAQWLDEHENENILFEVKWRSAYIAAAYGMHSIAAYLIAGWPDGTKLYKADIREGEGWWGSLFFGVRPRGAVKERAAEVAKILAHADSKSLMFISDDAIARPLARMLQRDGFMDECDDFYIEWQGAWEHKVAAYFWGEAGHCLNVNADGTVDVLA